MQWRPHRDRARGASSVEYIVSLVLVGIISIAGYKSVSKQVKCKITTAVNLFGGEKSEACAAANEPPGGKPPAGPQCFVAGTPVVTELGPRPIESLEVGTRVLTRDEEGGALDWRPVLHTFVSHSRSLVRLTLAGAGRVETLQVTPNHRVHVFGGGWQPVGELAPGVDRLTDESGAPLELLAAEALPDQVAVYNLEVAELHTYFVGDLNVWVHNRSGTQTPMPLLEDPDPAPQLPAPAPAKKQKRKKGKVTVIYSAPEPPPEESPEPPRSPSPKWPPSPSDHIPEAPPGPSLLDGAKESLFDHRIHKENSLWDRDKAKKKIEAAEAERQRRLKELQDAEAKLKAAQEKEEHARKFGSLNDHADAWLDLGKRQREAQAAKDSYDVLGIPKEQLDKYEAAQKNPPHGTANDNVGTLTLHVIPGDPFPTNGHAWVSFQANPDADPAHLTFTMWRDAQDGKSTPFGYFARREENGEGGVGYGNTIPGVVLIPDPVARNQSKSSTSYPVTQSQLDSLLVYVDDTKDKDYNLCTHNCTAWATSAVQAAGHTPPPSRLGTTTIGIHNPNMLHHAMDSPDDSGGCG